MRKLPVRTSGAILIALLLLICLASCGHNSGNSGSQSFSKEDEKESAEETHPINALLIIPAHPAPNQPFRVLATGGKNILKAKIIVSGPSGEIKTTGDRTGEELPWWRIDTFEGAPDGTYKATLVINKEEVAKTDFEITAHKPSTPQGGVWKSTHGWNNKYETLYSVWVNAIFQNCDEQTSWPNLHEVTQNKDRNFLYNYLSLNEDDPNSKNRVIMEPDCADNPFYLRAYFSWKLGLPYGFHICDRGYVGKAPQTGQFITNESSTSKANQVQAFNSFLRTIMNGVHSGTARTALNNDKSDYYPVPLKREYLRPGTVYADPYGHTLILVSWKPQTKEHPGLLLAVDAQPDKTIAIKRFWKGNFLFNTSQVVGEPGFKTFRPILSENGALTLASNNQLNEQSGFVPFSLQQKNMESEAFYHAMDRNINPHPLDPEDALLDLINALHEQLLVRVKSVSTGESYMKSHPGTVIPMPSSANGVFLAGGDWENFSTPNRDLRLLIAIDAVLTFPDRVARYPEDYNISKLSSAEDVKKKLQNLLDKKINELTVTYTRSDGSDQKLTVKEIIDRRDAFEIGYNPNDGVEIRWGAPLNSDERSTCKRHAPSNQQATMQAVRKWFNKRLHPPT